MTQHDIDLLSSSCGLVIAPAGCGKTQLIVNTLTHHSEKKPILILTHTNAGVAALRNRLNNVNVNSKTYRLGTIDGWAIKLISTFPVRSGYDPEIISGQKPDYLRIRKTAYNLLNNGHVNDVIVSSYSRLLVDEYQDCSIHQHNIIAKISKILPTSIVGDQMQAIFGFDPDDPLADWKNDVLQHFKLIGKLNNPWRWINAGTEKFGRWLLEVRQKLIESKTIDLKEAPEELIWKLLDDSDKEHDMLLQIGRVKPPSENGSVLIIGESARPKSQQKYASQTPGAVTVEAVDLRDLTHFAQKLNIHSNEAVKIIAEFAQTIMTGVGAADLLNRIEIINRGTSRKQINEVEQAAINFGSNRNFENVAVLLEEMNKQGGSRTYRPDLLRACFNALRMCSNQVSQTFEEAVIKIREKYRLLGRNLPKRAVGSTLLLKGLEAEVCVILNADKLNDKNLYVAMTRGSKRLIICSKS